MSELLSLRSLPSHDSPLIPSLGFTSRFISRLSPTSLVGSVIERGYCYGRNTQRKQKSRRYLKPKNRRYLPAGHCLPLPTYR